MTNISIAYTLQKAAETLRRGGVPDYRREASALLQEVIKRDRTFLITHADDSITAAEQQTFFAYVARRAEGEPLQYITGHQDFFGLEFEVTKDVLIPRPETELMVEIALRLIKPATSPPLICDVGTGSGCIVISLLTKNERANAVATDLSIDAIGVARRNASRHAVGARISFVVADCLSALKIGKPRFDLIVSNPPYVATGSLEGLQREVRNHEPRLALAAGSDGLVIIRRLLFDSGSLIKTGGFLLLEIGFDQGTAVHGLIDRTIWKLLDIHKDLQGIPRIVALQKTPS